MLAALYSPKTSLLHRHPHLRVTRKGLPDKTGAQVFGHKHTDPQVDAEHIRVIPFCLRMKGIAEPIPSPRLFPILLFQRSQHAETVRWQEGKRSCRCIGNDGAVDVALTRRPSPCGVAMLGVRSTDAPIVRRIGLAQAKTE